MKKHEREEIQDQLAGAVLIMLKKAIDAGDVKEAKKLSALYNRLDRGW
jgi:hypothetical protein